MSRRLLLPRLLFVVSLGLCSVLLTTARVAAQTSPSLPDNAVVDEETIQGFKFLHAELAGNTVRWQPDVPPEKLDAAIRAIETGSSRVPRLFDAPVRGLDFYLLRDSEQLQTAIIRLGSGDRVSGNVRGVSIPFGNHPGVYVDASALGSEGRALVVISHEIAHQVIRDMLKSRVVPSWFDEGIATLVGVTVATEADQDYGDRYMFVSQAILANGNRADAIPPLTQLVISRIWSAEAERLAGLPYDAALLGFHRVVAKQGFPALRRVLERVAMGQAFDVAFTMDLSESPDAFERKLFDQAAGLAGALPSGLSAHSDAIGPGRQLQFAYPSLEPGEILGIEFIGPNGCHDSQEERADALGFAAFQFSSPTESECAGDWLAIAVSASGIQDTAAFVVTASEDN